MSMKKRWFALFTVPLFFVFIVVVIVPFLTGVYYSCLLYTSDAADEERGVDLGGGRVITQIKKKNRTQK